MFCLAFTIPPVPKNFEQSICVASYSCKDICPACIFARGPQSIQLVLRFEQHSEFLVEPFQLFDHDSPFLTEAEAYSFHLVVPPVCSIARPFNLPLFLNIESMRGLELWGADEPFHS